MRELLEEDYSNINKIVENDKKMGGSNNSFKIFIYLLFVCLINQCKDLIIDEVYVINGKNERQYINRQKAKPLYYGIFTNDISEYRHSLMHMTCINKKRRLAIIFNVIFSRSYGYPKGYILDYVLWKEFFGRYLPDKIGSSGHYDRLSTQIALLAHMFKKKYYMKQHGLIGHKLNLPSKIPVYSVVAYDDIEADKFQQEVVLNADCLYSTEYISSVEFVCTKMCHIHIGIIDTPIKEMNEIILGVIENLGDIKCTVMQHPRSNLNLKQISFDTEQVNFVCSRQKEFNYDLIISGPSTLAYDYVMAGYDRPIFVYVLDDNSGLCDLARRYSNVRICSTINGFLELIKNNLRRGE